MAYDKKYFYCTMITSFTDGRENIKNQCKHKREQYCSVHEFNTDVELWNRQGQYMKSRKNKEKTPINGYDYYITESQKKFNYEGYYISDTYTNYQI